jgi:hypothetical protein
MMKIIGIAVALAVVALATPAIAQSFDPDNGTGNIVATVASPKHFETRTVPEYPGADAYALSAHRKAGLPGESWGSPNTTTGGGSAGYNEMLLNW